MVFVADIWGCPSSLALVLVYPLVVGSAARLRCRVVRERCVQCTNVRKRLPLAQPRRRPGNWRRCSWTPRTIEQQGVYGADSPSYSRLEGIIGALRGALEPPSPRPIAAAKSVLFGTRSASLVYRRSGNRLIASHSSHEGLSRARPARGGPQARASYYECPAGPAQLCHRRCARRVAFKTSGRPRRQPTRRLIARNPRRRRGRRRGHQGQRLLPAGPALRLRRAGAVHRRGDDEVPPRQAPRDLRRRHQRQARREGPAPYC